MKLQPRQSLIVYAKDKKRLSAFYRQTLDLELSEEQPTHDLLRGRGIEILVHAIPQEFAASIDIATPPLPREETPFKPVFEVADLGVVRRLALATGGFLLPLEKAWSYGGATILDGWDPEGNVVQFRCHAEIRRDRVGGAS